VIDSLAGFYRRCPRFGSQQMFQEVFMLRKLKVPALALIVTLSSPVLHAEASSNDFDKLMDLSGVTNSIEAMSKLV